MALEGLNNTNISSPTGGQCVAWDATASEWTNQTISGDIVAFGASQIAVFQVPVLADTTLTTATASVPVFHNISSFTGAGLSGILTPSVVSNIARVTVGQAGYVNIHYMDEVQITSSNTGAGSDGELVIALSHYNSSGTSLRSWMSEASGIRPYFKCDFR